ncbi:hypothetical protein F5X71_00340 [Nocardia brasiliensis]|uniref:Phage terminase-like protein, large subunit n=1 Tax=Nocardia brasiliensis TaxID=37326 RepID=A0A6G9XJ96_NOCBR|nr:hypothetical protein [Nocardia brasiliensis]QIS00982.1 hypothetical protein F5X71_00340 [Nocardia brasiliensis]
MLTSWPRAGLVGTQEPRVAHRPTTAVDYSAAEEAFDLVDIAGRRLPPWQSGAVRDGTARRADGKWSAFEVCLLASRQNGKNGVLEAVVLWWMIHEPGVQILYTAHEFKTALKTMVKLMALFNASPLLQRELMPKQPRQGNGRESITLQNGSCIYFATRTAQGGRGGSYDRLIIDEAMICSPEARAALMPLLTTAANPQVWYLGSAADADSQATCGAWASLRRRALDKVGKRLLWLEWSAPELPDGATAEERAAWRMDRRNWAAANPSCGYLFDEEFIEDEVASFADQLDKWEIERLSSGKWPRPAEARERVIPAGTWEDMTELDVRVQGPIALALDMTGDLSTVALGAATRTVEGKLRLELGHHGPAQGIVERVAQLVARWDPCAVVINSSSPARHLAPKLLAVGIEVETSNGSQAADAAVGLVADSLDGLLSHAGDPRLADAVRDAKTKPLAGGKFGWDYLEGDVTRIQAISLARWGLLEFGLTPSTPPQMPTQDDSDPHTEQQDELMAMGF